MKKNKTIVLVGIALLGLYFYFKNKPGSGNVDTKAEEDRLALEKQMRDAAAAELRKNKEILASEYKAGTDVNINDLNTIAGIY